MSRKCLLAREKKREDLVKKYFQKRQILKIAQKNSNLSIDDRIKAQIQLNKLPRDSSPSRLTCRCQITGCARSVYKKFKLNRITFRQMALKGLLPGVIKSSW